MEWRGRERKRWARYEILAIYAAGTGGEGELVRRGGWDPEKAYLAWLLAFRFWDPLLEAVVVCGEGGAELDRISLPSRSPPPFDFMSGSRVVL